MKKPVKRRMPLYVSILAAIVKLREKAAPILIAQEVGAVQDSISLLCRQMVDAGVLRVVGKRVEGAAGRPQYVFAIDGKQNAGVSMSGLDGLAVEASIGLLVFCDVIKRLSRGNVSKIDLKHDVGVSREYTDDLVNRMLAENLIYVSDELPIPGQAPRKLFSLCKNIKTCSAQATWRGRSKTPFTEPLNGEYITRRVVSASEVAPLAGKVRAANSVFALGAA